MMMGGSSGVGKTFSYGQKPAVVVQQESTQPFMNRMRQDMQTRDYTKQKNDYIRARKEAGMRPMKEQKQNFLTGPKIATYSKNQINQKKDHEWGALGW